MLGTLCYLLSACNDDVMDPTEISGNDILKLNFSTIDTRADLDDSGVGTFSENDKIGLYILSSTYKCNFLGADNKQ